MKTSIFSGNQIIQISKCDIPVVEKGEVLVRVLRTALCGSDIKVWRKGARYTPGHEILGLVEQPGHPLNGGRYVIYIPVHCQCCSACIAGNTQMCLKISELIGWDRPGGYAEYLTVPEQCLLPVPEDIDNCLAPLLLDTIGTSTHAVRKAIRLVPPLEADDVLVTGAGPVGLGVVLALLDAGYRKICVFDPNDQRSELACFLGAERHDVNESNHQFSLIIECSGAHVARDRAIELVLPQGAIMLVGENPEPWLIKENPIFRRKDFAMVRTFYFSKTDHELNIELLRRRKDEFRKIADLEFSLNDLPEQFTHFAAGDYIKPLLCFESEYPNGSHPIR